MGYIYGIDSGSFRDHILSTYSRMSNFWQNSIWKYPRRYGFGASLASESLAPRVIAGPGILTIPSWLNDSQEGLWIFVVHIPC